MRAEAESQIRAPAVPMTLDFKSTLSLLFSVEYFLWCKNPAHP